MGAMSQNSCWGAAEFSYSPHSTNYTVICDRWCEALQPYVAVTWNRVGCLGVGTLVSHARLRTPLPLVSSEYSAEAGHMLPATRHIAMPVSWVEALVESRLGQYGRPARPIG